MGLSGPQPDSQPAPQPARQPAKRRTGLLYISKLGLSGPLWVSLGLSVLSQTFVNVRAPPGATLCSLSFHRMISLGTACGDSVFCCLGTASGDPT